jgi:hypothetical protein
MYFQGNYPNDLGETSGSKNNIVTSKKIFSTYTKDGT